MCFLCWQTSSECHVQKGQCRSILTTICRYPSASDALTSCVSVRPCLSACLLRMWTLHAHPRPAVCPAAVWDASGVPGYIYQVGLCNHSLTFNLAGFGRSQHLRVHTHAHIHNTRTYARIHAHTYTRTHTDAQTCNTHT